MISQFQDEDKTLQMFIDISKKLLGNNLKAIVLFGSRASGMAGKYSDYDFLIIAENLPSDWRKRDNIIFDRPIKILHGKSCIDRLFHLYSKNISGNILRIGINTWKITGEINV